MLGEDLPRDVRPKVQAVFMQYGHVRLTCPMRRFKSGAKSDQQHYQNGVPGPYVLITPLLCLDGLPYASLAIKSLRIILSQSSEYKPA